MVGAFVVRLILIEKRGILMIASVLMTAHGSLTSISNQALFRRCKGRTFVTTLGLSIPVRKNLADFLWNAHCVGIDSRFTIDDDFIALFQLFARRLAPNERVVTLRNTIFLLVSSTVSKIQLFLLSLVGALPAGFLTFLLCMYLIDQPTGASTMVMIFAIVTVLCTATLTALPVLIMTMYYSNYDPPKTPKAPKKKADAGDEGDAEDTDDKKKGPEKGKAGKATAAKATDSDDGESVEDFDEIGDIESVDSFDEIGTLDDDEK
jgi:hypothetical protein